MSQLTTWYPNHLDRRVVSRGNTAVTFPLLSAEGIPMALSSSRQVRVSFPGLRRETEPANRSPITGERRLAVVGA
jgi:hypothetical protein